MLEFRSVDSCISCFKNVYDVPTHRAALHKLQHKKNTNWWFRPNLTNLGQFGNLHQVPATGMILQVLS